MTPGQNLKAKDKKPSTKETLRGSEQGEDVPADSVILNLQTVSPRLVNILQPHPPTSAFIPVLSPFNTQTEHSVDLQRRQNTQKLQRDLPTYLLYLCGAT